MDIHDILALDKSSRELVKTARRQAEQIDAQTPELLEELRARKEQTLEEELAREQESQNRLVATRTAEIERQLEGAHARLDAHKTQHGDQWVETIVKRVTEV